MDLHIILENSTQEVLRRLQNHAPSYVIGGYLRDQLTGVEPVDIDIATEMPISDVKRLFPNLSATEKGWEFGVGRFNYHGKSYEFSTYEAGGFHKTLGERDFTVNSLYHDGTQLIDMHGGISSIEKKTLFPLESPDVHLYRNPQSFLRALRLSAHLGFGLSEDLLVGLHSHAAVFHSNSPTRIQQEGYRILSSSYPLIAFHYLGELERISPIATHEYRVFVPSLVGELHMRLTYLAFLAGKEAVFDFIDQFQLAAHLKEKVEHLLPYITEEKRPTHPKALNEALILKRYQYNNDKELLRAYMLRSQK